MQANTDADADTEQVSMAQRREEKRKGKTTKGEGRSGEVRRGEERSEGNEAMKNMGSARCAGRYRRIMQVDISLESVCGLNQCRHTYRIQTGVGLSTHRRRSVCSGSHRSHSLRLRPLFHAC